MARRRENQGGGSIAEHYIKTGLNLLLLGSVGIAVVTILASVLGNITSQFPVTSTNPLYNMTRTWESAVTSVGNFIAPLAVMGIAVTLIFGVIMLLRVFL